ncbi:MAG: ATPase, T2SS/T4P/T4SS family [Alkalispirochaeta sp.]
MRYSSTYCRIHGVVLLDEGDDHIRVGAWRPVGAHLRGCLETYHRKRVEITPVAQDDPEVRLALLDHPEQEDHPDLLSDRTFNLPPVEEFLRRILREATRRGATDLSVWRSGPHRWEVSLRIAGRLESAGSLDGTVAERVVRHLVARSGLDLLDRRSPQDGIVTFPWLPDHRIRIALLGDDSGRYVALRILNRRVPDLRELGYGSTHRQHLVDGVSHRLGLVLFAGPTGSGKTTGIAALLAEVAAGYRKIVSLEDPVEYSIPGVVQIERSSNALRGEIIAAALRQDPDVLAFGEVRRRDHAEQLEAAILSGHLVVTSVHAGDAEGARHRLMNLGISRTVLERYCHVLCLQRLDGNPVRLSAEVVNAPWRVDRCIR